MGAGEPEGDEEDFSNIASRFLTPPAPEGRAPPTRVCSGEAMFVAIFEGVSWLEYKIMVARSLPELDKVRVVVGITLRGFFFVAWFVC